MKVIKDKILKEYEKKILCNFREMCKNCIHFDPIKRSKRLPVLKGKCNLNNEIKWKDYTCINFCQ